MLVPNAMAQPASTAGLADADLDELLAPIALYPDPLLANVLAAVCYPDELIEAKQANGDTAKIDAASWEPAVMAVAKIPDLIGMLTQYPEWTTALGEAFILQSEGVMTSVQRLRARAYANGALQTTQQQVVTADNDTIVIVPAQPDVIYVPTYSPSVVYVDNNNDELLAGVIGFGIGITAGIIIGNNLDCDWHGGGCCYGCGWGRWHGGGNNVNVNINNNNFNNVNVNNIKNNGNRWKANQTKINQGIRNGQPRALNSYRGAGEGRSKASIPSRESGAKPISMRPAPRPSQVQARPNRDNNRAATPTNNLPARPQALPAKRPDSMKRSETPRPRPSVPPVVRNPTGSQSSTGVRTRQSVPAKPTINAFQPSTGAANRGATSRGAGSRGAAQKGR